MGKLFGLDSPLMAFLNQMVDLVLLNVLTILCCLPVVTIGAAVTALYDAAGKLQREEGHIYVGYFRAFRANFKQATALWLLFLIAGALLLFSINFYSAAETVGSVMVFPAWMLFFLWAAALAWVFPLQAQFANPVPGTLRNAFMFAIAYLPRSIGMMLLNLLPWILLVFWTNVFLSISIFWIVIGFALTAYTNLWLLKKPVAAQIAKAQETE